MRGHEVVLRMHISIPRRIELNKGNESELESIVDKITSLLLRNGVYNSATDLVDVDVMWQQPETFEAFSTHLVEYVAASGIQDSITTVLAVDKVRFPFGLVPIASVVALRLGKPLAVWKENANILTGAPHLFGHLDSGHILLLHDVVVRGLTPLRVIIDLHKRHASAPTTVLTIVDTETSSRNGRSAGQFIREEAETRTRQPIRYLCIVPISRLREGARR